MKRRVNDYRCQVLKNEFVATNTIRMRLANSDITQTARPGHFVNIRVRNELTPLLRRPFSLHRINQTRGWLEILFDIRGKGTEILSQIQPGTEISVLGPLGQPFKIQPGLKYAMLIGGGLGIAPLLFLAEWLRERHIETHCFYGVRAKSFFCTIEDFEARGVQMHLATDDGSVGHAGFVTDLFVSQFNPEKFSEKSCSIFACGPPVMLRKVQEFGLSHDIETQLSLESMMGCGFGVCVGCAVPAKNPVNENEKYKLVCQHGPVFHAEEVIIPD